MEQKTYYDIKIKEINLFQFHSSIRIQVPIFLRLNGYSKLCHCREEQEYSHHIPLQPYASFKFERSFSFKNYNDKTILEQIEPKKKTFDFSHFLRDLNLEWFRSIFTSIIYSDFYDDEPIISCSKDENQLT